jgi:hypothetical protein
MKINEIRIGNYVYDDDGVYQINEHFYILLHRNIEEIKPIPINQDWIKYFKYNFLKYGFPNISVNWGVFEEVCNFVIDGYRIKLDYVHELQNLYFSITKNELQKADK